MSRAWAFVACSCFVFFLSLSRLYLFSLTIYIFSVLLINFPTIIDCVILDSDIAGSSEDTQRIQSKPNYQVRWDPYVDTNKQNVTCWHLNILKKITHRGAPYWWINKRSTKLQLWKKQKISEFKSSSKRSKIILIEKHFTNSKAMIRELGHVELFELCETFPKVKCSHCLLHRNQGIAYCTCGRCLIDSESRRKFNKPRLDALTVPNYVIKKGRCHGARHGKTEVQREYHLTWNAWERCCKKVDSQGKHFTSIHDRFLSDPDKSAKSGTKLQKKIMYIISLHKKRKDTRTMVSFSEHSRQKWAHETSIWFQSSCLDENRLHHESEEQVEERLHPDQQRRSHSSPSTSRWDKSECNWKWAHKIFYLLIFCYSWFRLQSIAIHSNRRGVQIETPHMRLFLDIIRPWSHKHCGSRLTVSLVRIHSICMSSMMSHVWTCIACSSFVFFLSLSRLHLFSLTGYLLSVLLINFHDAGTGEG